MLLRAVCVPAARVVRSFPRSSVWRVVPADPGLRNSPKEWSERTGAAGAFSRERQASWLASRSTTMAPVRIQMLGT